jgi:hypothetical protein
MENRVYEFDSKELAKLKSLLEADPYADISFARQGYKLKDGKMIGADAGKYYLYIKAEPDFFKFTEEKLKEIAGFKRSDKKTEEKICKSIDEEEGSAEVGFGSIFGEG